MFCFKSKLRVIIKLNRYKRNFISKIITINTKINYYITVIHFNYIINHKKQVALLTIYHKISLQCDCFFIE